jgi:hypothetical protein
MSGQPTAEWQAAAQPRPADPRARSRRSCDGKSRRCSRILPIRWLKACGLTSPGRPSPCSSVPPRLGGKPGCQTFQADVSSAARDHSGPALGLDQIPPLPCRCALLRDAVLVFPCVSQAVGQRYGNVLPALGDARI